MDFLYLARNFLSAAKTLSEHDDHGLPALIMMCQAAELYLKAFLRAKNFSVEELRGNFGHDLEALFNRARELDENLFTPELGKCLGIVSETYRTRDYLYRATGRFPWPPPNFLEVVQGLAGKFG